MFCTNHGSYPSGYHCTLLKYLLQKKYSTEKTERRQSKKREEKSGLRYFIFWMVVNGSLCIFVLLNILSWQNAKDFMWWVSQWN